MVARLNYTSQNSPACVCLHGEGHRRESCMRFGGKFCSSRTLWFTSWMTLSVWGSSQTSHSSTRPRILLNLFWLPVQACVVNPIRGFTFCRTFLPSRSGAMRTDEGFGLSLWPPACSCSSPLYISLSFPSACAVDVKLRHPPYKFCLPSNLAG